ncbi:protein kinase [Roseomonas sp. PWR1]|uniref:Protein kinase n=1 Tax=Roseomonas nitratireducens TaxID=2820810 RepID=A0ABS4ARE9_9PROT|nr:protein kinase [Neoroseomonas nitratireducens]
MSHAEQHLQDDDPTLASLAPAADGTPALIAGRYEVRDSIGRGAFGEVFEAYDRVLGRLVAVKVMPIAQNLGAEGRESLRRFQVEARAVSRLTHPNIITVHDFGQGERFAWIVMELVIGETLADALRRTGPPPLAETSRILCALLSALHAAHERGIVHRDVKPGNILLEMNLEDGLGEVRLSDFGIARTDAEDRTVVGQMIGTPWVMAPEQLRGEAVDRRTDLWAAGVILYDMLTGERPFKGSMPGIFHRIQHEEPPAPTRLRAELPPAADALVARALAKAPEDRFATAEEMAAAIRAALVEVERWQDAPPLPGLGIEAPAAGALVPTMPLPPPPAPAPARGRFGQGIAVGMVAGLALGIGASHVAGMAGAVAVSVGPPAAPSLAAPGPHASSPAVPVAVGDAGAARPPAAALAWMPEPEEAIRAVPASRDVRAAVADAAMPPVATAATGTLAEANAIAAPEPVAQARPAEPDPTPLSDMPQSADRPNGEAPADIAASTRGAQVPVAAATPAEAEMPPPSVARDVPALPEFVVEARPVLDPPVTTVAAARPADAHPEPIGAAPTPHAAPIPAAAAQGADAGGAGLSGGTPARVASAAAAPPPAPRLVGATPPSVAMVAPPAGPLPACGPDRLRIRTGSHDGHGRVVFDWSGPVAYRLTPGVEGLGIVFPDAGCRPAANGIRPARNLRGADAEGQGAALVLRIAPGAQPRDFRLGNRVVIDLADPAR